MMPLLLITFPATIMPGDYQPYSRDCFYTENENLLAQGLTVNLMFHMVVVSQFNMISFFFARHLCKSWKANRLPSR